MTNSGISRNSELTWKGKTMEIPSGSLCILSKPVFHSGLRNRIFITSQTLTFNPMPKSFVNYSHFLLCPWNIGAFGAVSKVFNPLNCVEVENFLY